MDVAVYPALFVDYPGSGARHSGLVRWALALVFIWVLTAINLAGVRITGGGGRAGVVSLLPVVSLTAVAGTQLGIPWPPFAAEEGSLLAGSAWGSRS